MSSSSLINSASRTFRLLIIHKTSTPLCRFIYLSPPHPPHPPPPLCRLVLDSLGFSFERADVRLPDSRRPRRRRASPRGDSPLFDSDTWAVKARETLANDDRTIKVEEGDTPLLLRYLCSSAAVIRSGVHAVSLGIIRSITGNPSLHI